MVNFYALVNKFCFVLCYLCPPMYLSLGISKSVYNQTLFEIPPLSQRVCEVAVSGSRQTKQFSTLQGGSPGVCPECHTSYVHPHDMENVSGSRHFAEIP